MNLATFSTCFAEGFQLFFFSLGVFALKENAECMDNRRKEPRRNLFYFPEVRFQQGRQLAGYLFDVTPNGLKLRSLQSFSCEQLYAFELAFPDAIPPPRRIRFDARCRWEGPRQSGVPCSYGFSIEAIDSDDRELLVQLIESYALPEEEEFKESRENQGR